MNADSRLSSPCASVLPQHSRTRRRVRSGHACTVPVTAVPSAQRPEVRSGSAAAPSVRHDLIICDFLPSNLNHHKLITTNTIVYFLIICQSLESLDYL